MKRSLKPETYSLRERTRAFLQRFHNEEDGVFVIFSLYAFVIMFIFTGMAVDVMRVETRRTELQALADRAAVAAADMQQTIPGNTVIVDYFAKAGLSQTLKTYNTVSTVSSRTATVEAEDDVQMIFGKLLGVFTEDAGPFSGSMKVKVKAVAEERIENVEISLALDISGSMASYGRIGNLKTAAKSFIDTVLANNASNGLVTVSLVPYSEQVNIGPDLFAQIPNRQLHNYSYCVDVPDNQFSRVSLDWNHNYQQDQHFQWNWSGYNNEMNNTVCPQQTYERITPWSQNAAALKNQIDQLQPRAGTAIYMGTKWAAALLDPSTRQINANLVASGKVASGAANRPLNYNTKNSIKAMVLMTDGENSTSARIASWAYQDSSHYSHWNTYNFSWYLSRYVYSYQRPQWYYTRYTTQLADQLQANICQAAKNAGIMIWTIGFEVSDTAANKMRNCASSPSHFYRVAGANINDAFKAIASDINELRLIE